MPYYERGNLMNILMDENEKISWMMVLDICEGMIRGVKDLHNYGIIHKNLSPSSFLVSIHSYETFAPHILTLDNNNSTHLLGGQQLERLFIRLCQFNEPTKQYENTQRTKLLCHVRS